MEETEARQREGAARFSAHPILEVCYEDLARAPAGQMTKILEFLGAESRRLDTPLRRQNPQSTAALIENHAMLKAAFADTRRAGSFEA
ncbi:MAG: sulfotransferase domain-containing protein [Deltaproteobacteria bacterium]